MHRGYTFSKLKRNSFIYYSAKDFRVIGEESHQSSMPVYAHSYGFVIWYAPGYFVSRCESDVSNFPFDTHTCKFVVRIRYLGFAVSRDLTHRGLI